MKKVILWGCGIGCGLLLLSVVAIAIGGALLVRNTLGGFNKAIEQRDELEGRFGADFVFTPWAGEIPPERADAFLRVRESTQGPRAEVTEIFGKILLGAGNAQAMEQKSALEKLRFGLGMSRSAMGLAPRLGEFYVARNAALLEADMSLAEYSYLYGLAYWGLLDHDPADGPDDAHEAEASGEVDLDLSMDPALRRVRRELREMLDRQLAALPPDADPAWRATLAAEIDALAFDRERLPWQDGLPPVLEAALLPHRDRLAATYSPATNTFELSRNVKRGRFSVSAE